jgi:crotonobetainyl-CoA:carnitine CoA-transferase CaiB-like acyl-CoA transferase
MLSWRAEFGYIRRPCRAGRFNGNRAEIRKLDSMLGAGNEAILRELGYASDEIRAPDQQSDPLLA